jgi:hypothetical protein
MVGKAQKSHGARSGLNGGCSNGGSTDLGEADAPLRLLRYPKKGSFKTT